MYALFHSTVESSRRLNQSPDGSSSGPAIGVSPGYAPMSLCTTTSGSLVMPATRAALYTLKSSHSFVPQDAIVPISPPLDTIGPMTKDVKDLVNLLEIMTDHMAQGSGSKLQASLIGKWEDLSIGTLKPSEWRAPSGGCRPVAEATDRIVYHVAVNSWILTDVSSRNTKSLIHTVASRHL